MCPRGCGGLSMVIDREPCEHRVGQPLKRFRGIRNLCVLASESLRHRVPATPQMVRFMQKERVAPAEIVQPLDRKRPGSEALQGVCDEDLNGGRGAPCQSVRQGRLSRKASIKQ